ncbi:MAG: hypothetical protein N3G77_07350 [Nitrososphaeria archaeon]|nr:hypothetical protein [Nitrososphaeria archaeon]
MEKILSDRYLMEAFEKVIQPFIEEIIDLLRYVIPVLELEIAEYNKDYVEICGEKRVMRYEVSEKY